MSLVWGLPSSLTSMVFGSHSQTPPPTSQPRCFLTRVWRVHEGIYSASLQTASLVQRPEAPVREGLQVTARQTLTVTETLVLDIYLYREARLNLLLAVVVLCCLFLNSVSLRYWPPDIFFKHLSFSFPIYSWNILTASPADQFFLFFFRSAALWMSSAWGTWYHRRRPGKNGPIFFKSIW